MSDHSIQVSWETGQQDQHTADRKEGTVMKRFLAEADVRSVEGRLAVGGIVPSTGEKQRQMLLFMYCNVDSRLVSCYRKTPDSPSNSALRMDNNGDQGSAMMGRYLADNERDSVTSRLVGGGQVPTVAEKRKTMALVLRAIKNLNHASSHGREEAPRGDFSK